MIKHIKKLTWRLKAETKAYENPLTYKNASRLLYFSRLFQHIKDIKGDVVECGVGRGRSLLLFSYLVKDEMCGRKIWGFDSFEGFPEPTDNDESERKSHKGEWNDVSIQKVLNFLSRGGVDSEFIKSQITLIKGYFNESVHKYRGEGIALLHLDGDLYESYKDPLKTLFPKVVPGGIVMFDEYLNTTEHLKFPGGQKAIDEYFGNEVSHFKRDAGTGKYYYIKPST